MNARYVIVSGPVEEPVSLAEFKLHARISYTSPADDASIGGFLVTAREYLESLCGPVVSQTIDCYLDAWPAGCVLTVARPRVSAISSIKYYGLDGAEVIFPSDNYLADLVSHYSRIVLKDGYSWPAADLQEVNGIIIRIVAGWASAAVVPSGIKTAIMQHAAALYENREAAAAGAVVPVPFGYKDLIANYREFGF